MPVIQAYAEGKAIQYNEGPPHAPQWEDIETPSFGARLKEYRIKPTPKRVPLSAEDVPPGSVIHGSGEVGWPGWCLITSCSNTGIRLWRHGLPNEQDEIRWDKLMAGGYEIKLPGGEWQPCWKEQAE